jgi:hypothetical protein
VSDPEEPWIEFLDEPQPARPDDVPAAAARRPSWVVLSGIAAAAALLTLLAVRLVSSDGAPAERATSPGPCGAPLCSSAGITPQVRVALAEHLGAIETRESTEGDRPELAAARTLVSRDIEASAGRYQLFIDITEAGSYRSVLSVGGGDAATVVAAQVQGGGYHIGLVATGRKGTVPSAAALAALGRDPRLLAVGP